jgi:CheY-like chemotaxis protein
MNKKLTIAIIDDDIIFHFIFSKLMENLQGVNEVLIFSDGKEAIDFINSNINNLDKLPDIIFLDINMQVMNGWQFLDRYKLLEMKKKIMIYIVSSSNNPDDIIDAKAILEVSDYLVKPIKGEQYADIIDSFNKKLDFPTYNF